MVVVVLASVALAAALAFIMLDRASGPSADPFAFDPAVAGTDVTLPQAPPIPPSVATAEPAASPPAAAPPAAAIPAAATGRLAVTSDPPGALVTVDGRRAGMTPITVDDLTIGSHLVKVALPGFTPIEERVEVTAAVRSRTLAVTLGQSSSAPGRQAPARGTLQVDSRPRGAAVAVDGRFVGRTPLSIPELASGTHVVELTMSGYKAVRTEVVVRAGERTRLALSLEAGARGRTH